jgi:hypothetical protein
MEWRLALAILIVAVAVIGGLVWSALGHSGSAPPNCARTPSDRQCVVVQP